MPFGLLIRGHNSIFPNKSTQIVGCLLFLYRYNWKQLKKEYKKMTTKKANLVFTTLLTGAIVTSLLQTSLTTALPKIMQELSLTALKAQWLTSAFSLAMAIMVPISAYLIKRYTTRQIFISSMILFSFGSLLSWYGSNFTVLLLGRIFQALGSGIVLPLTQVVIMTLYPTEKQGTAMGILGLASGAAPVIAPTLTGIVIDSWGWRSIFLITGIISLVIVIFATFSVKNVSPVNKIQLDYVSLLLCIGGLTGILVGLSSISTNLYESIILLVIGIILIFIFSRRQISSDLPFLNLKILKNSKFRMAVIISMLLYAVMMGSSTIYPILIQTVMKKSAVMSALIMLPGSLAMALINPLTGMFYDRFGINKLAISGSLLIMISCFGITFINSTRDVFLLGILYLLRLLGVGCLMMPIVTWGMQSLPEEEMANGTAIITALRTLSGALGTAVFMEVMTSASHFYNANSTANYYGVKFTFKIMTLLALIQLIISIIGLRKKQ